MTRHTSGPWNFHSYLGGNGRRFWIETADHRHGLASIVPNENASNMISMEEHEANVRLMAAAPDLLAACKRAKEYFDKMGLDWLGKDKDPLETAIAKAENAAPATQKGRGIK